MGACLFVGIFLIYSPTIVFDFVQWDDQVNVVHNHLINPPTWENLRKIWTTLFVGTYFPVTYSTWWFAAGVAQADTRDDLGASLNSYVFHLFNVVLHAANAVLVWRILVTLTRAPKAALLGAAVFAVHPLRVEAVAWVTGLKDLLSGFFALSAILFQITWVASVTSPTHRQALVNPPSSRTKGTRRIWLAVAGMVAYTFALLSKSTMVAAFPVAALLTIWLARRETRHVLWPLAGWLICAIPLSLITSTGIMAKSLGDVWSPLWARPFIAFDTIAFYLYKTLLPVNLAFDYGRTPHLIHTTGQMWWTSAGILVLVTVLFMARRWFSLPLICLSLFVAGLLPALGLMPFQHQFFSTCADRYTYLASLGAAWLVAGIFARVRQRAAWGGMMVLAAVFIALSVVQSQRWRDSTTLFNYELSVNPRSWATYNNLAGMYCTEGRPYDAAQLSRRALELRPDYAAAYANLGLAEALMGNTDAAIESFRRSLSLDPHQSSVLANLAGAHGEKREYEKAVYYYEKALEIEPEERTARRLLPKARASLAAAATQPTTLVPLVRRHAA